MAESIISPGVLTRENDISFITPAPIEAGAAFIGPTVKGPNNQPTIVTSYNDFTRKFGETFTSGSSNYEFLTSLEAILEKIADVEARLTGQQQRHQAILENCCGTI